MLVSSKAAEMKAAGSDIISLSAGEPDFETPDHIKEAAITAIQAGDTNYTRVDGTDALKAAITIKFKRDNGLTYDSDEISVNCGGKHTIYNALMATINPGDQVLIPAPYWVSYPDMTVLAGGTPVFVESSMDTGFKITPEALEAAITPKTKWVIFNNPGNPSGALYSRAEIAALGAILAAHPHVWVLADEIYEHLVYDGLPFTSFAAACPDLKARTLTMNGVSKAYAMTGWRIGYAGGDATLIKAMAKIQSQSTSCPSSISQAAVQAALTGPQDFMKTWNGSFQKRRDLTVSMLNAAAGISCPTPSGAFYAYPSIKDCIGKKTPTGRMITDDSDFVSYLLESFGVAAVPGVAFGLSPHFRVSYATSADALQQACKRIAEACAALG